MIVDIIEVTYDFTDEHGGLLYQEVRRAGKKFSLRRPDGNGGWINNLDGVRRVLYRLPELRKSTEPIFWVEGPKDVETLRRVGLIATTCASGVNGWRPEFAQGFRDRYLVVLRDNDTPGLKLRDKVVGDSRPYAKRIVALELPAIREKGDVTDWLRDGHTPAELLALVEAAEAAAPESSASPPRVVQGPAPPASAPSGTGRPNGRAFPEAAWVGPFAEYRRLVGPTTEAPDAMHWGALALTCGMLIGRQRYLCNPHPLYTNEYAIVIGETGLGRKSTALEYIHECLERLDAHIQVISGLSSAEGLYEELARSSETRALIFEDELRTLFAAAARKGTSNLLSSLCRLYRCPKRSQLTMRHGGLKAELPFVSLLGATTTTWVRSGLEEEAVTGGFFNRCLIISGDRKAWIAHPEPPPPDAFETFTNHWLRPLTESLRDGPARRMVENAEAWQLREHWYQASQEKRLKNYSEALQQLTARTDVHALKISLIYAVIQGHDTITLADLEVGIAVAEHCEALTVELLGDVNESKITKLQRRILSLLPASGEWIPRRGIQQQIGGRYDSEQFLKAMSILVDLGDIEQRPNPAGGRGPASVQVRLVVE